MIDTSISQGRSALLALLLTVAASPATAQLAQQAIHRDNSVSYMSSCEDFAVATGLACFEGRSPR